MERTMTDQSIFDEALAGIFPCDIKSLKYIMDKLPIGIMIVDSLGVVVYYNKAHGQLDGYEPEEIIGQIEMDIYEPDLCPDINSICQNRGKPLTGFISKYKTRRGREVDAAFWVYPLFTGGRVTGSICLTMPLAKNVPDTPGRCPPIEWPSSTPINIPRKSIVGSSAAFTRALNIVDLSADSPSPVLIAGETGCGKEMFARLIHDKSSRKNKPFLALNCAAIPATLIESILFGTVKGSFTGAVDRPGLFEEADGGTVYLDEIDSMPLELQPKLLRVLQEMSIARLGTNQQKRLNFKLVSSISCLPQKVLDDGRLRSDLFFRLAVIVISLPSLRERTDDLNDLVSYFIYKYNTILNRQIVNVEPELMKAFRNYQWPGNVRELEHLIAGAMNLVPDDAFTITIDNVSEHHAPIMVQAAQGEPVSMGGVMEHAAPPPPARPDNESVGSGAFSPADNPALRNRNENMAREIETISQALTVSRGNIAKAARSLEMSRQLLHYKMMKYHLSRDDFKNMAGRSK
ncbi:hypothetical protein C4J81_08005 [Deltaproteobacteria bacterium Smac51]|nr:hypothetical protein C4J81_08005 [Deltaproteobacteria bacterium Smac51]